MTRESQERIKGLWAKVAAGEPLEASALGPRPDVVIQDTAAFLREFGGGALRLPPGTRDTDLARALAGLQARRAAEPPALPPPAESDMQRELRTGLPPEDRRFWTHPNG